VHDKADAALQKAENLAEIDAMKKRMANRIVITKDRMATNEIYRMRDTAHLKPGLIVHKVARPVANVENEEISKAEECKPCVIKYSG